MQVDHKADGTDKPVQITGSASAVDHCKSMVFTLLDSNTNSLSTALGEGGGESERTLECPAGIVGRIIGRGGETIRSLQSGSGAHITIDQVGCILHLLMAGSATPLGIAVAVVLQPCHG